MPESWQNGGKGGCRFRTEPAVYRAACYGGARTIAPGDTLYFNLRLLITPFHPLDPARTSARATSIATRRSTASPHSAPT
jgi:hypothetical protein